jgi:Bacterial Ig domain
MLVVAAVVALTALNIKSVTNSPPVGVDDNFEVAEGSQLVVDAPGLLLNDFDPDGDPIASGFHSDPADGTILAMAQDGAFIYEPDPGFVGVDSFAYAVRDDLGSITSRVVDATISVTAAPDPTTDPTVAAGTVVDAEQMSGLRKSPTSADPRVSMGIDSAASPAMSTSSSTTLPLAVTGTTSNSLIPPALFGVGLLVIAFGVRRARNDADQPVEQA